MTEEQQRLQRWSGVNAVAQTYNCTIASALQGVRCAIQQKVQNSLTNALKHEQEEAAARFRWYDSDTAHTQLIRASIVTSDMPAHSHVVEKEKRREREQTERTARCRRKRAHALNEPSHRPFIRFSLACFHGVY